ncbi:hypothetical protein [Haladaptatus sp. DYF46]|uniref:hypothetical protein n=1 Tax=Haladaptatus sp. DYF46 TaxID=2886041 RepID=UPI001E5B34AC|nr:hypothetical protein [Haladaptatus sp. DYF46]
MARADGFYPTVREMGATARKSVLHINVLDDGTMVMLARVYGDPNRIRQLIKQNSNAIDHSVSDAGDGTGLMYVHSRLPGPIRGILRPLDEHEVFFESIEYLPEDEIRVTMIGETNEVFH